MRDDRKAFRRQGLKNPGGRLRVRRLWAILTEEKNQGTLRPRFIERPRGTGENTGENAGEPPPEKEAIHAQL